MATLPSGQRGFQPVDLIIRRCRVAKKDRISKHLRCRHRAQPIQIACIEFRVYAPFPRAHLLQRPVDQVAVVIAQHVNGIERLQHVHGAARVERATYHVAEIDYVVDPLRADVGDNSLQREIVAMNVCYRGKTHQVLISAMYHWQPARDRRDTASR
jgi:hypothetical protein